MFAATFVCSCSGAIIDLSYDYANDDMVFFPAKDLIKPFNMTRGMKGRDPNGNYWEVNNFCTGEHTGTHMDAPRHCVRGLRGINELGLDELIGEAVNIDISSKTRQNRDYQCTVEDIKDWERQHGEIPRHSFFFLNTGWHKYWPNTLDYLGSTAEWTENNLHYPGLHPDAAAWLAEERRIKMYGVDCISVDYGRAQRFNVHRILLSEDIPVLENVANLDKLPPTGARVFAIPMKIRDGTGSPTRVFAVTDNFYGKIGTSAASENSNYAITSMLLVTSIAAIYQLF